jgi:hypothetical protein
MASNTTYDRCDFENLSLFMPQDSSITDERMIQSKLWFMIKHIKKGMTYMDADAWSSIWVMIKYNKCTYDTDIMTSVLAMGNDDIMMV